MQRNIHSREREGKETSFSESRGMGDFKLNLQKSNLSHQNSALSPSAVLPDAWVELKVRDRFIEKRSQHAAAIYDSK